MNSIQLIQTALQINLGTALFTIADFSDDDLLRRPAAGANHALWQLGHAAAAEAGVIAKMIPTHAALNEAFAARFNKEAAKLDDAASFPAREAVIAELQRVRANTIAAAGSLTEADLDKASPYPDWSPTVGTLLLGLGDHLTMHVGQIQVLRRLLGKPVLY